MSVSISITVNRKKNIWDEKTSIYFEDSSADFYYLQDTLFLQIKNVTCKQIDLYDDTIFFQEDFFKIKKLIASEIESLKNKKEKEWEVKIGEQIFPEKREIFKNLKKYNLIEKLEKFITLIDIANSKSENIICIGD